MEPAQGLAALLADKPPTIQEGAQLEVTSEARAEAATRRAWLQSTPCCPGPGEPRDSISDRLVPEQREKGV